MNNNCNLVTYIQNKYNIILDYNLFIEKLEELFGNFIFMSFKDENSDYLLINKNMITNLNINIEFNTTIYKKNPFQKICSFMTPSLINNNAMIQIKKENFDDLIIKHSIEGIHLIMIYNNTNWMIISEKSLSSQNTDYRNKQIIELFNETVLDKNINLNDFSKTDIYYLLLVHHKTNGILHYNHYGCGYKQLYINAINNDLEPESISNTKTFNKLTFSDINDFIESLNKLSQNNISNKKITHEGYMVYIKSQIYKLQTYIYQQVINTKPKYDNVNLCYLELYKENKLNEYLPYYTNYHGEIIHRISMSIRTISKEFLDIYHYLKKHKKIELYNNLTDNYKKILYRIHGIYIDARKNDFINNQEQNNISITDSKSITVHDIYHLIKSLPTCLLKQIYFDREKIIKEKLVDNNIYKLFVKDCVYANIQTKLLSLY